MPKLLNQLNHGESKFNSELQIRNRKKNNSSRMNHNTLAISQGLRIFATLQNFARLQIFASCDTVHAAFAFLTFCHFFIVFPICPHRNSVCFVILVICNGGLAIKAPRRDILSSFSFSFSETFCNDPYQIIQV